MDRTTRGRQGAVVGHETVPAVASGDLREPVGEARRHPEALDDRSPEVLPAVGPDLDDVEIRLDRVHAGGCARELHPRIAGLVAALQQRFVQVDAGKGRDKMPVVAVEAR